MNYKFRNLLPDNLRDSKWVDLIDAFQSTIENVKTSIIDRIRDKHVFETATNDDLEDLAYDLGFNLSVGDGYTSTTAYLQKEVKTIVPRTLFKHSRKCYNYIYYIFNLIGNTYPLLIGEDQSLYIWPSWDVFTQDDTLYIDQEEDWVWYWDDPPTNSIPVPDPPDPGGDMLYLDNEEDWALWMSTAPHTDQLQTFDASPLLYTDDVGYELKIFDYVAYDSVRGGQAWSLDHFSYAGFLSRHLMFSYQFRYIENATEFLSESTLIALYNDVVQAKRKVEIPHFRAELELTATSDKLKTTTQYTTFDGLITANQESILITNNFINVGKIQFGTGAHTTLDGTITGVETLTQEYDLAEFYINSFSANVLQLESKTLQKSTLADFTEIALMNNGGGGCAFYSTFPAVKWADNMYGDILLNIIIT